MAKLQQNIIDARHSLILDSAAEVFAAKGFHKATIRDIAKQAGLADGTLYNYFGNKNELLIGLLHRINQSEQREQDLTAGLAGGDLRTFMQAYLRHRMTILLDNKILLKAVLPEILVNPELRDLYYQTVITPTVTLAEAQFNQLVTAGVIQTPRPDLLIRTFIATILGMFLFHLLGDTSLEELDELTAVWVDLWLKGIQP